MQDREKTFVVVFLLCLGLVVEILSQRVDNYEQHLDPVKIYQSTINRERTHNAAVVLIISALTVQTIFSALD